MTNDVDPEVIISRDDPSDLIGVAEQEREARDQEWLSLLKKEKALIEWQMAEERAEQAPIEDGNAKQERDSPERDGLKYEEQVRAWWAVVADILKMSARGPEPRLLPGEITTRLQRISEDLSDGIQPKIVKGAARPGNLHTSCERRDRAIAAAYVAAAQKGRIADKSFRKTIVEAYGLKDGRTVSKWAKDETLREKFPEVFAISPKRLQREIQECGERYKRYGPTQEAIANRAG